MGDASFRGDITISDDTLQILRRLGTGDKDAAGDLLPRVYDELKQIASYQMRRERADHTLQATILAHEAFMRLVNQDRASWQDRAHFMAIAATQIRRVLIDHARKHAAQKRGGGAQPLVFEVACDQAEESQRLDLILLDDVLTKLEGLNRRHARVVELRFFAGLSVRETSHALDVSETTVKNDWRVARAWLLSEMQQ